MATYVLVHGAYQGGWIWKPVATRLHAAGHLVFAPTLDGCGERHDSVRRGITVGTHAREVAQLLFYEDLTDVVLVGTSSGGMVIVKAAALARITPHPVAALEAPMEPTTFWEHTWPTTVIRCRRAVNPPESHQRRTG